MLGDHFARGARADPPLFDFPEQALPIPHDDRHEVGSCLGVVEADEPLAFSLRQRRCAERGHGPSVDRSAPVPYRQMYPLRAGFRRFGM